MIFPFVEAVSAAAVAVFLTRDERPERKIDDGDVKRLHLILFLFHFSHSLCTFSSYLLSVFLPSLVTRVIMRRFMGSGEVY